MNNVKRNVSTYHQDKWLKAIEEAKSILKTRKANQMHIASLAYEVCDIKYGGSNYKDTYTLRNFAIEIGMHPTTLHSWVTTYRTVYAKLPENVRRNTNYTDMFRTTSFVNEKSSSEEVKKHLENLLSVNRIDLKILRYSTAIKSIISNLNSDIFDIRDVCSKNVLEDCFYYVDILHKLLLKHKISPINHDLTYLYVRNHGSSGIVAYNTISDFLSKNPNRYFSPLKLGVKHLKRSTPTACKLASLRVLNKLLMQNKVIKNNKGQYKWIGKKETLNG